jgi:hypothetical protein
MFSGGEYEEVARWLRNFVVAHAKRENLRVEAVVETEGPPAVELDFPEVAQNRGSLAWCNGLAGRVRALAREFAAGSGPLRSA